MGSENRELLQVLEQYPDEVENRNKRGNPILRYGEKLLGKASELKKVTRGNINSLGVGSAKCICGSTSEQEKVFGEGERFL